MTPRGTSGNRFLPRRITPWFDAANRTLDSQLAQCSSDRRPAHRRQRPLKVGVAKTIRKTVHRIANHVALRATSSVRDADTLLELTVRYHEHHTDKVLPPWHEGVPGLMPAL